jgi:hypothetical protein
VRRQSPERKKHELIKMTHVVEDILRGEARHIGRDLVDGKTNVVEGSLLLVVHRVCLILLRHCKEICSVSLPPANDL